VGGSEAAAPGLERLTKDNSASSVKPKSLITRLSRVCARLDGPARVATGQRLPAIVAET